MENEIRKLDQEQYELFSRAVFKAIDFVPSFVDVIAVLRPFYDPNSPFVYVDQYARMGLSTAFFQRSLAQRTTTVLHEALHVINQHLKRGQAENMTGDEMLLAADFEVGSTLVIHPKTDTSHQVLPDKEPFSYKRNLTFEKYYSILKEDNEDSRGDTSPPDGGESGPSEESEESGSDSSTLEDQDSKSEEDNGSGESSDSEESQDGGSELQDKCSAISPEQEDAIDAAGIEKASDSEVSIAKNNTKERIEDELKRQPGNSPLNQFLGTVNAQLTPPKVNWKSIFKRKLSRSQTNIARGKTDFTYRKVNRRRAGSEFIFPGMQTYKPTVMGAIDSSGSMGEKDNVAILSEVEGIIKSTCAGSTVKIFTLDTQVSGEIQAIRKAKDLKFSGGGGTEMAPAFEYVFSLSRGLTPDIFILATDGGLSWNKTVKVLEKNRAKKIAIFVLITDSIAFPEAKKDLSKYATVLDISPSKK